MTIPMPLLSPMRRSAAFLFLLLCGLGMLGIVFVSYAQEDALCREELSRFCAQAETWPQRFHCLVEHRDVLSAQCRGRLDRDHSDGRTFMADCREDAARSCPGLEGRRLMECLQDSHVQLSVNCTRRIEELQRVRKTATERIAAACKDDVKKFCQNILPVFGQRMIRNCLKEHETQLRDACRLAL